MAALPLEEISVQLESPNLRDRMVALASLRNLSPEDAVPLIKKGIEWWIVATAINGHIRSRS